MFLQATYNAQQLRFPGIEYDLCFDSMIRLQEYVDISTDEVQELIDDGLLRRDTDHPHRLYSVTPAGRTVIGEHYRSGVDYGHGKGDLEESSQHVLGVEVARRFYEREYVGDPDHPVVELVPYYGLDENRRLDLAGLDEEGEIVLTIEVERVNNDIREAVPADFDKMAACEPEEAIWIAMSHTEAHEILEALQNPPDGNPRVEKMYSKNTPASEFRIDEPGFTSMVTLEQLREQVPEPEIEEEKQPEW